MDPISDLVLKIIKEIQSHMHDGIPSMGIPPLDPLNISKYDFDVREPSFKAYGQIRYTFAYFYRRSHACMYKQFT